MDKTFPEVKRTLGQGPSDPTRNRVPDILPHVSHAKPGIRALEDKLYVITSISNPIRYRSRYELYRAFEKHVEESGGILYTIEQAFGNREFEITTEEDFPYDIQIRNHHATELWHKENLINLAIQRLPPNWKYVCWADSDISFTRPDWVQETLHQLQHYKIVQCFSHAQDVGPNYEPLGKFDSFMYSYVNGVPLPYKKGSAVYPYPYGNGMEKWHCGYAFAARREAIDELGGLIDFAILGSADHNMCTALIGKVEYSVHGSVHPNFMKWMKIWQARAEKHIRRNVGYVDGLIIHHWHGPKRARGYIDRWKILTKNQFNPETDIKRDWQGLWQLQDHHNKRSIHLRDDIRRYFRSRQEDSIDV